MDYSKEQSFFDDNSNHKELKLDIDYKVNSKTDTWTQDNIKTFLNKLKTEKEDGIINSKIVGR